MGKFALILLFLAVFFIVLLNYQKTTQDSKEIVINTNGPTLTNVLVDTTEDSKALGFSGQNKIVEDSKGNLYVTYRKKVNGYYEVFVSKLAKGESGVFEVLERKNVSNIGNRINQRVASLTVDSNNNLHLIWYGADSPKNEGNRQIKYATSKDQGENWSKPVNISLVKGYKNENLWQEHPDILVDEQNQIFVVWEGKSQGNDNQQIKFSKSTDGVNWTQWKNIKVTGTSQSRPTIIEDKKGVLYVFMYGKINSKDSQIFYSTSTDEGISWADWINISNSKFDSRHLDALADNQNQIHVAWRQFEPKSKSTQIFYSGFDGNAWSKPEVVSSSTAFQFFPGIGVDSGDNLFITWMENSKKSGYPEEDPDKSDAYISYLRGKKKSNKFLISSETFYPNITSNSKNPKQILLLFSKKEYSAFSIYLTQASF